MRTIRPFPASRSPIRPWTVACPNPCSVPAAKRTPSRHLPITIRSRIRARPPPPRSNPPRSPRARPLRTPRTALIPAMSAIIAARLSALQASKTRTRPPAHPHGAQVSNTLIWNRTPRSLALRSRPCMLRAPPAVRTRRVCRPRHFNRARLLLSALASYQGATCHLHQQAATPRALPGTARHIPSCHCLGTRCRSGPAGGTTRSSGSINAGAPPFITASPFPIRAQSGLAACILSPKLYLFRCTIRSSLFATFSAPLACHSTVQELRLTETRVPLNPSWPGCQKAYGTLNHLNAHVTMQRHGQKRSPNGMCFRATMPAPCHMLINVPYLPPRAATSTTDACLDT